MTEKNSDITSVSDESMTKQSFELQLQKDMRQYYDDPLGFVLYAFKWGVLGDELEKKYPDQWQINYLSELGREVKKRGFDGEIPVLPIRKAVASGHGIGKSALVAWIILWIMSTRPDCKGTVTANTVSQLKTKTWAELSKWYKRCINRHWFEMTNSKGNLNFWHKGNPEGWFCAAQTCKEENSDAFAGQHAETSSSFYIFDEASEIPEQIWDVAEGGLTDGEPMIFAFGNPTNRWGKFFRVAFGRERHLWSSISINSMDCKVPNKELFKQWISMRGWDSDFVRVRVRGRPPRSSDLQYIDHERVTAAQKREGVSLRTDPVVVGVDVARGGADRSVIYFRKGLDAKTVPPIIIPGEETRDEEVLVNKVVDIVVEGYMGLSPDIVNVDGTGVGGPIANRIRARLKNHHCEVNEINFASKSPKDHAANMRAYIWWRGKEWLTFGAIWESEQLEMDLEAPQYGENNKSQLLLESKKEISKRGLDSPDIGDAFCLTFAKHVEPKTEKQVKEDWARDIIPKDKSSGIDYNPLKNI